MLCIAYWILARNPSVPGCERLFSRSMSVTHQADGFLPPFIPSKSKSTWHTRLPRQGQLRHPLLPPTFPHPSCVPLFFFALGLREVSQASCSRMILGGPVVSDLAGLIGSWQTGLKPHWGRCLSAGKKSKNQSRPAAQSSQSAASRAAIDGCQASRASRSQQQCFPTFARVQ